MSKATLILFSMPNCGYCKMFKGQMPGSTDIWGQLQRDNDIERAGVSCKEIVFGIDPSTRQRITLDPKYSFVSGAPTLWLEAPQLNAAGGVSGSKFEGARTFDAIKNWITDSVKHDPKFQATQENTSSSSSKAKNTPADSTSKATKPMVAYEMKAASRNIAKSQESTSPAAPGSSSDNIETVIRRPPQSRSRDSSNQRDNQEEKSSTAPVFVKKVGYGAKTF